MPRSPLTSGMRRAFEAALAGLDAPGPSIDRRTFLLDAVALAGVAVLGAASPLEARTRVHGSSAKIAILGAGLAGLNAARLLLKRGMRPTIYEASNRIGGRVSTLVNVFGPVTTELGGEFIDSGHADMLGLVRAYDLPLLDMMGGSEPSFKDTWYFDGRSYTDEEIVRAFMPIAGRLKQDIERLPEAIDYRTKDSFARELDRLSIVDYLHGIGAEAFIRTILIDTYVIEYGMEAEEQSALNLLKLISPQPVNGRFGQAIVGDSDERYKIRGGNETLVIRMAEDVGKRAAVHSGHRLIAMRDGSHGGYKLIFEVQGRTVEALADYVICTIPFSVLRRVELPSSLSARKRKCIDTLGYGTNAKVILGFRDRFWRDTGHNGAAFTDEPFQFCWDSTRAQPGTAGTLTMYLGGKEGVAVTAGTVAAQAEGFMPAIDRVFPGANEHYTHTARRAAWPQNPWIRGSYAAYKIGQWTSIAGSEIEPEGRLYFAGEHCSREFQGFMNGAAETARAAVSALMRRLVADGCVPA